MAQPFKTRIGVVGGGQLGKMLIESAQPWNVEYNILDQHGCPAERYATQFISGKLTDPEKIRELAEFSDVITYEIEHINAEELKRIELSGKVVIPSSEILLTIQDKGLQKLFYKSNNLPTANFKLYDSISDGEIAEILNDFRGDKIVVKSRTGGYDGKGVAIVSRDNLTASWFNSNMPGSVVVEEFVGESREISVIVARNKHGEVSTFPIVEMVFDPAINLVDYLFAPARMDDGTSRIATKIATDAIEAMNGIGLFAVEMFITSNNQILINEIAPRPHNSGHHTIEACVTSQYEQLNRVLLDLPLGETTLLEPVVMTNIIGPKEVEGGYRLEGLESFFKVRGAQLHWYNKAETRPGRKMGHFTVMAKTLEEAIERSTQIRSEIFIVQDS